MPDVRNTTWVMQKSEAEAPHGMVAAMHPRAAAAGLEMLQEGGNAVDAAVATAFALGVVEPFMSGVGGVAAMVVFQSASGRTTVVDGSSTAPSAARPDTFELLPASEKGGMYGWRGTVGDAQNTGYRSPIVPGMPACSLYGLAKYGSGHLSRQQVMAPAIRLAEDGFPVDPFVAQTTAFAMRRLQRFPETMRTFYYGDGTPLRPLSMTYAADRLVQSDLARTLRALADHGPDAYYQGEIGERIAADIQANGGLITREDVANYRVRELTPALHTTYRDYTLVGIPETSGCATAYEAMNILERFDLAALGQGTAESIHLVAEALRRAFLDRFAHLADPASRPVPFDGALSKAYAAELAAAISVDRADPDAKAGDPWRFQAGGRPLATAASGAGGEGRTTHLTVVDKDRNVVSMTSTLGELFGCGVVPRGTGVVLNNGMTWFDPEPGHVNSIEPGKRILWAPTPTIVLKDGRPVMGLGAPGGRRIMSAIVQSLVNVLDFGLGVQDAVTAPRIHCEGPTTVVDSRLGRAVLDGLEARGHRLEVTEDNVTAFSFARPNGILIDQQTGHLTGGVNQFAPAWAMGH
jgi:gamma-glutamyltranspeptidase / glutathione hydrolase